MNGSSMATADYLDAKKNYYI